MIQITLTQLWKTKQEQTVQGFEKDFSLHNVSLS